MFLNETQLYELSKIAREAALRAGEIIAKNQGSKITVQKKEGGENIASCVVTEIDLAAEAAILNILSPTLKE